MKSNIFGRIHDATEDNRTSRESESQPHEYSFAFQKDATDKANCLHLDIDSSVDFNFDFDKSQKTSMFTDKGLKESGNTVADDSMLSTLQIKEFYEGLIQELQAKFNKLKSLMDYVVKSNQKTITHLQKTIQQRDLEIDKYQKENSGLKARLLEKILEVLPKSNSGSNYKPEQKVSNGSSSKLSIGGQMLTDRSRVSSSLPKPFFKISKPEARKMQELSASSSRPNLKDISDFRIFRSMTEMSHDIFDSRSRNFEATFTARQQLSKSPQREYFRTDHTSSPIQCQNEFTFSDQKGSVYDGKRRKSQLNIKSKFVTFMKTKLPTCHFD